MDIKYKKAFTEVYEILKRLDKEEYEKIPENVIEAIKNSRDLEYEFKFKEGVDIEEQDYLPETRAIIFNLFKDYFANSKQKALINEIMNKSIRIEEERKKKMYDTDVFKPKKNNDNN